MSENNLEFENVAEHHLAIDSAIYCLCVIAGVHGRSIDPASLKHDQGNHSPWSENDLLIAAKAIGFRAALVSQKLDRLDKVGLPAIVRGDDGKYFILARAVFDENANPELTRILVQHPHKQPEILNIREICAGSSIKMILIAEDSNKDAASRHFDFKWFLPAIWQYRRILGEVILISFVLQMIGLATPLAFQVVMDKVLVNQAIQTLNIIGVGLVCAIVFEIVLGGIRNYAFSQTSSKIDVELGSKIFRHLLSLPIGYFHSRCVGDSVARVQELENIRSFFTGNAVTALIDVIFSFVFFGVMFYYSPTLTAVVAASVPLYFLLSIIFTPVIRHRLNIKFNSSAASQSFLVESIGGIETIKALAIEPQWQKKWDKHLAGYVAAGQSSTNVAAIASAGVMSISKIVTAMIMWIGASLVVDGQITIGGLVAFNMLSSQISAPILRLAQLWNDFQQVGISIHRLGDILNSPAENSSNKSTLPSIHGTIEFSNISFRYRPGSPLVLADLSFKVHEGEIIGIVGRSGSGKSTLTKLLQRLYVPESGSIRVDGHDLANVTSASLRSQLGVVLQENNLFIGSIRQNITMSNGRYGIEDVIAAAKRAGAHDFICQLGDGYETQLGENGVGLSGGQRQRIAIARALISNPRILIFDEATSALDYESERIIQDNMSEICRGRTVIIIAHRLSAVRDADRIFVMDRGKIAESGTHGELLENKAGIYSHLQGLQYDNRENDKARIEKASIVNAYGVN